MLPSNLYHTNYVQTDGANRGPHIPLSDVPCSVKSDVRINGVAPVRHCVGHPASQYVTAIRCLCVYSIPSLRIIKSWLVWRHQRHPAYKRVRTSSRGTATRHGVQYRPPNSGNETSLRKPEGILSNVVKISHSQKVQPRDDS